MVNKTEPLSSRLLPPPPLHVATTTKLPDHPSANIPSGATKVTYVKKVPIPPPVPTPVTLLRKLFATCDEGRTVLKHPPRSNFQKPSQTAIDAYDVGVVRAVREGNVSLLRNLVEEGQSLDACNRFGESLLHMACRRGNVDMVRFFVVEVGVEWDVRDDFGRTPLHDACWTPVPRFEVMDVLMKVIPPEMLLAEDVRGHTPFHYARKEHWEQWISFLEERSEKMLQRISPVKAVG